ncbi:hypothetical protein LPICM02_340127 [Pseudolactococcus piscium]|nr:hypothetical protein LPICM02_340127 [Lactococcus piscium]
MTFAGTLTTIIFDGTDLTTILPEVTTEWLICLVLSQLTHLVAFNAATNRI